MPGNDDLWDSLMKGAGSDYTGGGTGSMDAYLSGTPLEGESFTALQDLTDRGREKNALRLPVEVGTRVAFAGNLGAVMGYKDPPMPRSLGTVVTVKSANGEVTEHLGKVFVQWDDGKFRGIHATHLRLSKGTKKKGEAVNTMRVASLGDLTAFLQVADDTLVHRSTRDLWSFRQDGTEYVIERMFDQTGDPVKG